MLRIRIKFYGGSTQLTTRRKRGFSWFAIKQDTVKL